MSIFQQHEAKLHTFVLAILFTIFLQAVPMFLSELPESIMIPAVQAGDPEFDDIGG